jgi:hypothetical protein
LGAIADTYGGAVDRLSIERIEKTEFIFLNLVEVVVRPEGTPNGTLEVANLGSGSN